MATARMLLGAMRYAPMRHLHDIRCPVLVVAGEHDSVIPMTTIKEASMHAWSIQEGAGICSMLLWMTA